METETKSEIKKNRRKQIIFRRVVLDNHPLPLKEMRELLDDPDYDERTAKRDLEAFEKVGCLIELRECRTDKSDKEFVFLEGPHTDDDTTRENINVEEKRLVARLAASLICGIRDGSARDGHWIPPWMADADARNALERLTIPSLVEKEIKASVRSVLHHLQGKLRTMRGSDGIDSADRILGLLKRSIAVLREREKILKNQLYNFWAETSRLVAIDSGTTNIHLAKYLRKLNIPLLGSPLCSLTVCTNSRRIFEELGPSDVWVKTIIIGGQQMFRSPTIAGAMAESFLRSVSILHFGMCVLGSTRIDLDRFAVCSDSQEESGVKNLLMDRSSLRIVCVDNSKLQSGPGREGYRFASVDPKHIDLILTNSPFKRRKNATKEYKSFIEKVEAIEMRGVPVLVATSDETFDYPNLPPKPVPSKRRSSASKTAAEANAADA